MTPPLPLINPQLFLNAELENVHEDYVLVLIQWHDDTVRRGKKRLMLMVLNWIDDNHAERLGLLTQYSDEFSARWIDQLPRSCKQFIPK